MLDIKGDLASLTSFRDKETEVQRKNSNLSKVIKGVGSGTKGSDSVNQ